MSALKYRPDIDGMRAVAVLGVVIYHAFPWMIPGGFIGVDIFFVISGYLISGILYKGHKEDNFSYREFYARRIRRLFPALITVLLLCLAYGWLILLPEEFQQVGKHVAAGTLFIQNIIFWQESGYFDTAASLKPLLHLWSLAVEEQFYIFFPPILLLIWKRKWSLVLVSVIMLIFSLVGNLLMSQQSGVADFFLTPYRAWEFMGGGLLAWWHYDRGHEEEVPLYREVLSWSGIALLVLGFAFIKTGDSYPGWRALLPVAGTLLLMEGGAGTGIKGAWINRKILSNPAVVWIGLISYPLYLFHWPALSFVHIVKGESPKPVYLIDALFVALSLAVLTYYFIEKKIRHNKSRWTLPLLGAAFLIVGILGACIWQEVIPARARPAEILKFIQAIQDRDTLAGWKFLPGHHNILVTTVGGDGPQTLFLGDSNMQQYAPRIAKLLKNNKEDLRGAIMISRGGVPPIPLTTQDQMVGCGDLMEQFHRTLDQDPRVDRVVIVARWGLYFMRDAGWKINGVSMADDFAKKRALSELDRLISEVVAKGKKVTLVSAMPTSNELDPKRMCPRGFDGSYARKKKTLTQKDFLKENAVLEEIMALGRKNHVEVVDPMDVLCVNGICIAEDENGPNHYDANHLRSSFVREKVKYLDHTVAP